MPPGVPDAQGCIYSGAAIHFKRHLDVLNQLVIDAEIEVVHIAAPVAGGGNNPVCLAGVGIILLLIIQKVSIEFTHNVILVAEHEKSCGGGMFFSSEPISTAPHFRRKSLSSKASHTWPGRERRIL